MLQPESRIQLLEEHLESSSNNSKYSGQVSSKFETFDYQTLLFFHVAFLINDHNFFNTSLQVSEGELPIVASHG